MFRSPQIIAIDDQDDHLAGLANCLNRNGIACLRMHVTGDLSEFVPCPNVRIIFSDLHLLPGTASDYNADYNNIGALLEETIKPTGPYLIVLWTQYPDKAPALRDLLDERLGSGVTKPFAVCPLPKARHIVDHTGEVRSDMRLMQEIDEIIRGLPEIGALFEWEGRVLGAAGRTVSSILDLASREDPGARVADVGRILGRLAVEAVGKNHVDPDRFRAVNDALLPILADRVAKTHSAGTDKELWRRALKVPEERGMSSVKGAARLNKLVHIAEPEGASGTERGVVVPLPEPHRRDFRDRFGITEEKAATKLFGCKDFDPTELQFRWVLVQCQAACDYAQGNPGTLPFYLGLDFPERHRSNRKVDSTWRGPVFEFGDEIRCLRVHAGCPLALASSMVRDIVPMYRLREQMLNNLIYHLHSHGARPGMISFGKR